MKIIFHPPEAKIEMRHDLLATLPWLYNTRAVDERLKVLGLRRSCKWRKIYQGKVAFVRREK